MLKGSLEKPSAIVIEVIDFFLMDIGSGAHTQFTWGSELTEYYEQNPHLMEDGIRTGVLHSHHNMGTFFSGEDVDDLRINTQDKDVDYYLSIIVNNRGAWISRLAFRTEEEVQEKVKVKFWNKINKFKKWTTYATRTRIDVVLCMIPLEVEDEGQETNNKRFLELEAKKERESYKAPSWVGGDHDGQYWNREGWIGNHSRQLELGDGGGLEKVAKKELTKEEEEKQMRAQDILFGRLFAVNLTYDGGLDAAVRSFRKKVVSPFSKGPLEGTIIIHAEHICSNARKIIEATEGYDVTPEYVLELLDDLQDMLIDEYMEEDEVNALALGMGRHGKGEIEILVDALDMLTGQMELDTKTKEKTTNGNTEPTGGGEKRYPRTF